ncbi:MAG: YbjQ family protein [Thermoguttaceae bacterium]|nr:YbjQ family protein [Thermoguttaceae bacterium]
MIIVTTNEIPGHAILEVKGIVTGNVVRSKHVGRDIMANLKSIVGGELKGYTELLLESRQIATSRMVEQALQVGANAIVSVRYSSASIAQNASEMFCYGTAVVIRE